MLDKLLKAGFNNVGQFDFSPELIFNKADVNYNFSNIIYAIVNEKQVLYIGESQRSLDEVIKRLLRGSVHQETIHKIHNLIRDNIKSQHKVYLIYMEPSLQTKKDFIQQYKPQYNFGSTS